MSTRGPKEVAYDDLVCAHLAAIRDICRDHRINFAVYFALDEVMPGSILQTRLAIHNDPKDLVGMFTVDRLGTMMIVGEKNFEDSTSSTGRGN